MTMQKKSSMPRINVNYQIFLPGSMTKAGQTESFLLQCGAANPDLEALHDAHGVTSSMFMTAHNPGGAQANAIDNMYHQSSLFGDLSDRGLVWMDAASVTDGGLGLAEPSLLIMGVSIETAYRLANQYGQHAFVYAARDAIPHVVATASAPLDLEKPATESREQAKKLAPPAPVSDEEIIGLAKNFHITDVPDEYVISFARDLLKRKTTMNDHVLAAVYTSSWNRVAESIAAIYKDKPGNFSLTIGHLSTCETPDERIEEFSPALSITLDDTRADYDRRAVRRESK
jgi:hypothetical protein